MKQAWTLLWVAIAISTIVTQLINLDHERTIHIYIKAYENVEECKQTETLCQRVTMNTQQHLALQLPNQPKQKSRKATECTLDL